ncbi:MAG: hypothetical protein FWB86_06340 [Treponema sp.]|nr:hypothetical protein [Treponema sp.]MCL2251866.1 hypothetical protein [Treponema sp.]
MCNKKTIEKNNCISILGILILSIATIFSMTFCDIEKNESSCKCETEICACEDCICSECACEDCGSDNEGINDNVLKKIEIIDAVVFAFNMSEQSYPPYTGSITKIYYDDANVSGSIINGKLNLIIDAPSEKHFQIFKDSEIYKLFEIPNDIEIYGLIINGEPSGIIEIFPVIEDETERKLMLGRFREDQKGNGICQLFYSTGIGQIKVYDEKNNTNKSINVKEGWNYFELADEEGSLYEEPKSITIPGDNYKWYIWEYKQ